MRYRDWGQQSAEDGFTLVELVVVMIIIGILAAIAIPVYLNQKRKGYEAQAVSDMRTVRTAIEAYAADHGNYSALDGATQNSPGLFDEGFVPAEWTQLTVHATHDTYCVEATHVKLPDEKYVLDSSAGTVAKEAANGPGCS